MYLKFDKFTQKGIESDSAFYQVHRKEELKKFPAFESLSYWTFIISLIFVNYYLFSSFIFFKDRNDFLHKNDYWLNMQKQNRKECATKYSLNQTSLNLLEEMMHFLNHKSDFNYFMCFSSLYYAVKVENYDVFNSDISQNIFYAKNYFYLQKSEQKCVKTEFGLSEKGTNKTELHLCYLNTFLKEKSLCDVVNILEMKHNRVKFCDYNRLTGEYKVIINDEIEIIFHEYHLDLNSYNFFNFFNFFESDRNATDLEVEFLDENAKLNQGWLGKIFFNQYFSLPRHFFYSKLNTSRVRSNFVNYLGVPIRLPSEVINYFMIFFSEIWYS